MVPMLAAVLSNVPADTANLLAYSMMVLVAIFLVFGPTVYYYFWRQSKKSTPAAQPETGAQGA